MPLSIKLSSDVTTAYGGTDTVLTVPEIRVSAAAMGKAAPSRIPRLMWHQMARIEPSFLPKAGYGCSLVSDKWAAAHFFVGESGPSG
jgi:hypothetical protein